MRHTGKAEPVPHGLVLVGPIIKVIIRPPSIVSEVLVADGKEPPEIPVKLMIDTGAQKTVIEDQIARDLGLHPIRYDAMVGVSQVPEDCPVYRACIVIGYEGKRGVDAQGVFEADIVGMKSPARPMDHMGLLGRDFLRYVRLVYNGPTGSFEINDGSYMIPPMSLVGADKSDVKRRLVEKKEARKKEKRRKTKKRTKR